ncbi:hypothetical protein FRB90_003540 [Tulasnella sp. 427]|nr:hypothetical protein FRB90_003540 [Tulasnella sp. 427]
MPDLRRLDVKLLYGTWEVVNFFGGDFPSLEDVKLTNVPLGWPSQPSAQIRALTLDYAGSDFEVRTDAISQILQVNPNLRSLSLSGFIYVNEPMDPMVFPILTKLSLKDTSNFATIALLKSI